MPPRHGARCRACLAKGAPREKLSDRRRVDVFAEADGTGAVRTLLGTAQTRILLSRAHTVDRRHSTSRRGDRVVSTGSSLWGFACYRQGMGVIVGQDRVVAALTAAVLARRLAHGLLFVGPDSVGREATARALARGLLCEKRDTDGVAVPFGCSACRACRRVDAGTHPDLHLVLTEAEAVARGLAEPDSKKARPSTEIKIDAVRDICRILPQRPYESRTRVVIVVDAHRMNERAQNALLKGLEEPGAAENILVLIVPGLRSVLPTIASRCQRLIFAPLTPTAVATILETKGIADAKARASRPGVTSVSAALRDLDDDDDNTERLLRGLAQRQRDDALAERLQLAADLGRDRADVEALLTRAERQLAARMRARVQRGDARASRDGSADELDELVALEGIAAARQDLGRNASVQLAVERLLLASPPTLLGRGST